MRQYSINEQIYFDIAVLRARSLANAKFGDDGNVHNNVRYRTAIGSNMRINSCLKSTFKLCGRGRP